MGEDIFNRSYQKGLIPIICNEPIQISEEKDNPSWKWGKKTKQDETWMGASQKRIWKCPINIQKHSVGHSSSG